MAREQGCSYFGRPHRAPGCHPPARLSGPSGAPRKSGSLRTKLQVPSEDFTPESWGDETFLRHFLLMCVCPSPGGRAPGTRRPVQAPGLRPAEPGRGALRTVGPRPGKDQRSGGSARVPGRTLLSGHRGPLGFALMARALAPLPQVSHQEDFRPRVLRPPITCSS